ncbi:MAG: endonuclease/exonuclease/phosphatase family protein [Bacteroidaceae bacterium]|nr:endonuclease/exonuclease/phosphatase family protein [Bacteroidaceae bacterium]
MGIIFCWNYVRDYCPINLQKKVPESACKIMSYNVVGFNDDEENGLDGYKTIEYISKNNADIIFLQECPSGGKKYLELAKRMTDSGYNVKANGQLRIYSKLPFVGETIYSESKKKGNGTFACMVEIKGDTVVLINNHLESNSITEKEKDDYSEALGFHDKDKVKASGRVLLSRLSLAATKRAEQTDSLCSLIRKYERYDMIVCGDMNDTPISYTYQQIANLLKNAYEESGTGLGISFNRKGFPVRIDHIFTSKGLKSARTFVNSKISSSDHRPIITNIYKNTETKQASNVPE